MLKVIDITKSYGAVKVLQGVSMQMQAGEVVALTGASGAGKTTLLQITGTLDLPDSGKILFNDKNILDYSSTQQSRYRNCDIGFVFQFHNLLPEFSALENICIPAFISQQKKHVVEKRAQDLLNYFGLAHRAENKPSQLSGGEQQRIAFARALINNPKLILADEPTGNLDSANANEMHQLIFKLRKDFGQSFLIVTHNQTLAQMADRSLHMVDGKIVE
ncbi:MAG: ABC transporter ATP-binding protein [Bacteroidetes bacterium]|nr:ABC transporter ATP-binding protein [Bacteroidota bacterium]